MAKVDEISNNNKPVLNSTVKQVQSNDSIQVFPTKNITELNFIEPETCPKNSADVAKLTGLSPDFVDTLIKFEGFKNNEYKDKCGVRTIGVGHNIDHDPNYTYGKIITDEQAYKLLTADLIKAKNDMKECIGDVELTQGQYEALLDLFFNVGIEKLQNTNLIKCIKEQRFEEVPCEFNFICAKGVVDPALCRRRIDDIDRFCSGQHTGQTLDSIQTIAGKGKDIYDKKIKTANVVQKMYYANQKDFFVKSTNQTILKAQKSVEEQMKNQVNVPAQTQPDSETEAQVIEKPN